MKKLFNTLRTKGKIDIQVDYHKAFKETAQQVIGAKPNEYDGFDIDNMVKKDCIIRVEFLPHDKPMPALSYSHDLELALKDVYNQYLIWQPKSE